MKQSLKIVQKFVKDGNCWVDFESGVEIDSTLRVLELSSKTAFFDCPGVLMNDFGTTKQIPNFRPVWRLWCHILSFCKTLYVLKKSPEPVPIKHRRVSDVWCKIIPEKHTGEPTH